MNKLLISPDDPEYQTDDRFKLHFSGLTNLLLPFDGTIVLPRPPHGDDPARLDAIRHLNHPDWIFYSMLYPRAARADEAGLEIVFPSLRGFDNKPFGLGAAIRPTAGKVMVLVARGHTLLDDFDGEGIFDKKPFYSPRYPDNASLSSLPNVIVIHLDKASGDLVLPSGAQLPSGDPSVASSPFHAPEGFSPFTSDDGAIQHLKSALTGGTFSGEIYGFDLAGNIIDGYALAIALEFGDINDTGSGDPPQANEMFLQLVDAHGRPLDPNGTTARSLDFDPPLSAVTVGDGGGGLMKATFPDPAKPDLEIKFALDDGALDTSLLFGEFPYQFRHTRVGLWPGFGHGLKTIKTTDPVVLKLAEDFPSTQSLPPFARICVLHPGDEFQTKAGGEIDVEGVHLDNKFRLYTDDNRVTVFNTGEAYFADIVKEAEDRPLEILEGVYLTNWKSQPNVFMHGRMVGYGVERNNAKDDEIRAVVADLIAPHKFVIARLDPLEDPPPEDPPPEDPVDPADEKKDYLLLTRKAEFASSQSFQMYVEELASAGAANPFIPIHRGFVRQGGPAAWVLTGDGTGPHPSFRLSASWKNSVGRVELAKDTLAIPAPTSPASGLMRFPEGLLALGVDGGDPPGATLRQVAGYAQILDDLVADTVDGSGQPVEQSFDDTGRDLRVIFLHLESGLYEVIPLSRTDPPVPGDPFDVLLHSFERLFCTDEMAVALVDWPAVPADFDLSTALLTHWRKIAYPIVAFERGEIPLSKEELGGWLRDLIATRSGLDLRALYWEHTQANLSPGLALDRGLSNSAAIAAVLNRSVLSKSGMAVRDRSTRQLGSFHQKGVVLVKRDPTTYPDGKTRHRVVAYVGGIDLAHGRWDTEGHYHLDPERQNGGGWRDVQIKIEGGAALDVLKNFTQRWKALVDFDASSLCKPANVVNGMEKAFKVPKHLIDLGEPGPLTQVTRTWPPASCHAGLGSTAFVGQDGELGALESYLKAIRNARKFILINDQYLFGIEIAQAIREALLRPDGPECAMIMLPINLSEVEIVDPVIYKTRKRAFDTLFYGAAFEGGAAPDPTDPHRYEVNPTTGPSLRDRIAIVTPVNRNGDEIYVHSKQMIVDDVFMTIGSANFTFRGSTYEMEINAATVDRLLQQGGGVAVREQRIELCRRMLGLPMAYATLLQDWNACFQMFKAIETETQPTDPTSNSSPGTLNLHPLPPMIKQLPPGFAPKLGAEHQGYNQGVSFVMDLDNNSSGMLWLMRNAIDIDGRDTASDQILIDGVQLFTNIAYLYRDTSYLSEFPHNPPSPYGRLTFDLNALKTTMEGIVDGGDTLSLIVSIAIEPSDPSDPPFSTEYGRYVVTLDGSMSRNIVIEKMSGGELLLPIHVDRRVDVGAELKSGGGTGPVVGVGAHAFDVASPTDPLPGDPPPVTNGVFIDATVALNPPPP